MGKSIKEALQKAASFLQEQHLAEGRAEAELLLAHLLEVERSYLYAHGELELDPELLKRFRELCRRRSSGEPSAYIRAEKEFMGLSFHVERGVLIPRPETEHLVEEVLKWAQSFYNCNAGANLRILDLGTGSGNISSALAYYLPRASFVAVDIAAKALEIARLNSLRHGVEQRITLLQGHYYHALSILAAERKRFHIIVSNPPYIEEGALPKLPLEVKQEPLHALCGGRDGLDAYREIIAGAHRYLVAPGLLALEVGAGQAAAVAELACQAGFNKPGICRDYAGIKRVLLFQVTAC